MFSFINSFFESSSCSKQPISKKLAEKRVLASAAVAAPTPRPTPVAPSPSTECGWDCQACMNGTCSRLEQMLFDPVAILVPSAAQPVSQPVTPVAAEEPAASVHTVPVAPTTPVAEPVNLPVSQPVTPVAAEEPTLTNEELAAINPAFAAALAAGMTLGDPEMCFYDHEDEIGFYDHEDEIGFYDPEVEMILDEIEREHEHELALEYEHELNEFLDSCE